MTRREQESDDVDAFFDDLVTPEVPPLRRRRGRPPKPKNVAPPAPPPPPPRPKAEDEEEPAKTGWPYFWPTERPFPDHYLKRAGTIPCPACRRLHLDSLSQAVCCVATAPLPAPGMAYFRCRACEHRFKLRLL